MSERGRLGADQNSANGRDNSRATVRSVVLVALLLLTFYAAMAGSRLWRDPLLTESEQDRLLSAEAALLAARADGALDQARAAMMAGIQSAAGRSDRSLDVAEAALKAGRPALRGVAVATEGTVRAVSGEMAAEQAGAVHAAARRKGGVWVGRVNGSPYLVVGAGPGQPLLIGRLELERLGSATAAGLLYSAGSGEVIAGFGAVRSEAEGLELKDALGVAPSQLTGQTARVEGRFANGEPARVAAARTGTAQIVAIAAKPKVSSVKNYSENAFLLISPLLIAAALMVVLWRQSWKAEAAEAAFTESERRFRLAVEAARCGVWEWDLEADAVFLSEVMGVMLGWGGGGVVSGEEVLARIAPEHRERVRQALEQAALHGAFDVSFRVPAPAGKRSAWIDARGQAFGDASAGAFTRLIGVALDVTDERQAQARAQAAEARLRDAIDSVSEAFVLFDARGRLLISNRTFRDLFRLQALAVKPGTSKDIVFRHMNAAISRELKAADGRKDVREAELPDGRWVQISERRTAEGGLVVTGADVTAIKTQEETRRQNEEALTAMVVQLERSQAELAELARKYEAEKVKAEGANKSKSEFLANMSHELRTPLNAINGFSEIMVGEMYGPLGDRRYREYARDIHASGQHLLALINDILDMSKIEAGKLKLRLEPVHLEDVAEDAVRLMRNRAEASGLTLVTDLARAPEAEADYRAVKQILLNLLSNAVKFTPRGGQVSVTAEAVDDRLRVSVMDTGIGISKSDLDRLARPFEQVESQHAKTTQGTGLGLALTKSLVELHGGVLELTSEPGRGTIVSFTLPLLHVPAERRSYAA